MNFEGDAHQIRRNLNTEIIVLYPIIAIAIFCLLISTCGIVIGLYLSKKPRKIEAANAKPQKGEEPQSQIELDPLPNNTKIADHFLNDITGHENQEQNHNKNFIEDSKLYLIKHQLFAQFKFTNILIYKDF